MFINYKKLVLHNFGPFDHVEFSFTPGKFLVIGENLSSSTEISNGGGKSFFISEPIPWVHYKKIKRGDISRGGNGDCYVETEFSIKENTYKNRRYLKDKEHGNKVQLFCNDEEISHRNASTTDKEILNLIQIPYELFVSSIIVQQGLQHNFSSMTPTLRKQVMESLLGFSVWDEYRSLFQGTIKERVLEKNTAEDHFTKERENMISMNSKLETLKSIQNVQKGEVVKEQEALDLQKVEVQRKVDILNKAASDNLNGKELLKMEKDYDQMKSTLSIMKNRVSDLIKIIEEKICPTCGQDYPEEKINQAKEDLVLYKDKITRAGKFVIDTNKIIKSHNEYQLKISDLVREQRYIINKIETIVAELQKGKTQTDTSEVEKSLTDLTANVNELKNNLETLNRSFENLKYIDSLLLPSSKFRTSVLEKYIGYINHIVETIIPLIFENVELTLEVDSKGVGIEISIKRNKEVVSYDSLSGGEKKKIDIAIILSFQRFLLESSNIKTNLIVLDEIFDALDSQGIENVIGCLDVLYDENTSVYVISHNAQLKEKFDNIIKVIKENNISRVEFV